MPSPGWGHGKPPGGVYWTKARVVAALRNYAAGGGDLITGSNQWNLLKKGRLDLPTSQRVLELFGTMARAWLAVGVERHNVVMTNTRWSKTETAFLLEHAGAVRLTEIAKRLNRSYSAVRTKLGAKGMGLKARETSGYLTGLALAKDYGCSYSRVQQMLADGTLKATYSARLHRWQIDPADAAKVRHLLQAPKRTHTSTPPDMGNYREKYGLRRLTVHQGADQEAAS